MVTKRIRSEYMKKFKDPQWETYSRCYEEMLRYRLTRRLLEHTHNPWFWTGSDSDSDSRGGSPPHQGQRTQERTQAELEECEGAVVPRHPLQEEEEAAAQQGSQHEAGKETSAPEERQEQRVGSRGSKVLTAPSGKDGERDTGGQADKQSKPSKSSKQTLRPQRVRPAPARQPTEDGKDTRHPFALYGSGERDADIAARRTHNVGPMASTNEIHSAALRAKTRRAVERQIQTQRSERRRAKSADVTKARTLVQPEFNPWLTEYMRCFSARSR